MNNPIYQLGLTVEGKPVIGGVWALAHAFGFPLELSIIMARERGWVIDWLEAMLDASRDDNCPSLMRQVSSFIDAEHMTHLKHAFVAIYHTHGGDYAATYEAYRSNRRNPAEGIKD